MVANYKKAEVFLMQNPVGIDSAIQRIQLALTALPWLERSYGRCTVQRERLNKEQIKQSGLQHREIIYPETYQRGGEPINLMPNDNLKAYSFFSVYDPGEFENYDSMDSQHIMVRPVAIYFWLNFDKIEPGTKARVTEKYILDVLGVLKSFPDLILNRTFETPLRVFDEFTITDVYQRFMKLPFGAFRINGELSYPVFQENEC